MSVRRICRLHPYVKESLGMCLLIGLVFAPIIFALARGSSGSMGKAILEVVVYAFAPMTLFFLSFELLRRVPPVRRFIGRNQVHPTTPVEPSIKRTPRLPPPRTPVRTKSPLRLACAYVAMAFGGLFILIVPLVAYSNAAVAGLPVPIRGLSSAAFIAFPCFAVAAACFTVAEHLEYRDSAAVVLRRQEPQ